MAQQQDYITLTGVVEGVTYQNKDNGFSVIDISCEGELLTVVGEFPHLGEGEEIEVSGEFTTHPTFGRQFKAVACVTKLPATTSAILKYLSSGAIKGIGPVTARRIVDTFGADTLEIIEHEPVRLSKIRGISPQKAREIGQEYQRIFGIRSVMAYMGQFGCTPAESMRAWKQWGAEVQKYVGDNPYLLCSDTVGLSFDRADAIAMEMGLDRTVQVRIEAAIQFVLKHNTHNGHTCLPRQRLTRVASGYIEVDEDTVDMVLQELIDTSRLYSAMVGESERVFLPAYYRAEQYIATRLNMIREYMPDNGMDITGRITAQEKKLGLTYADTQREAISQAMRQGMVVLTGGPGTGKTTTINSMLDLFEEEELQVSLCAPTGRAAKRMSALCGREAKTIHRLLQVAYSSDGLPSFVKGENDLLDCDVVILDEISMVDTLLFEALLRAMKLTCKLVLVGDYDQLPSVGAGNLLKDIIDSGEFPVVRLDHIFRQAAQSVIVQSAHKIISGEIPDLTMREGDFYFLRVPNKFIGARAVVDLVATRLPAAYGFQPGDIQVLSPSRKGSAGCEALNASLRERLNPPGEGGEMKYMGMIFRQGDKVMQTRNNYDIVYTQGGEKGTGVFNGDMGYIQKVDRKNSIVTIDFEDKIVNYTPDMLGQIEHAYAVTVHKSQGSEFDCVVLSLLEPNEKLYYRNLLYTAVTRAKKLLVIAGSERAVAMMVENNRKTLRYGGLKSFFGDIEV